MLTDHTERIQQMVEEAEELYQEFQANLPNRGECSVCGVQEYELKETAATAIIELYEFRCRQCKSENKVERVDFSVDSVKIQVSEQFYTAEQCPCCGYNWSCDDLAINDTPVESVGETVMVNAIESTTIAGHHTSYKENEVIDVCASCHASIHHTDGFRDDLMPELSLKEARERGLVDSTDGNDGAMRIDKVEE